MSLAAATIVPTFFYGCLLIMLFRNTLLHPSFIGPLVRYAGDVQIEELIYLLLQVWFHSTLLRVVVSSSSSRDISYHPLYFLLFCRTFDAKYLFYSTGEANDAKRTRDTEYI